MSTTVQFLMTRTVSVCVCMCVSDLSSLCIFLTYTHEFTAPMCPWRDLMTSPRCISYTRIVPWRSGTYLCSSVTLECTLLQTILQRYSWVYEWVIRWYSLEFEENDLKFSRSNTTVHECSRRSCRLCDRKTWSDDTSTESSTSSLIRIERGTKIHQCVCVISHVPYNHRVGRISGYL